MSVNRDTKNVKGAMNPCQSPLRKPAVLPNSSAIPSVGLPPAKQAVARIIRVMSTIGRTNLVFIKLWFYDFLMNGFHFGPLK
jgi:hypothetical protein